MRVSNDSLETQSISPDFPKTLTYATNFPTYVTDGAIPRINNRLFSVGDGLSTDSNSIVVEEWSCMEDKMLKSINKNSSTGNRTLVLGFRVRCPNHWTTEDKVTNSSSQPISILFLLLIVIQINKFCLGDEITSIFPLKIGPILWKSWAGTRFEVWVGEVI